MVHRRVRRPGQDSSRRHRNASQAEIERIDLELAELRRNPLVRLGSVMDWAHMRRGILIGGRALVTLVVLASSIADILRFITGR